MEGSGREVLEDFGTIRGTAIGELGELESLESLENSLESSWNNTTICGSGTELGSSGDLAGKKLDWNTLDIEFWIWNIGKNSQHGNE